MTRKTHRLGTWMGSYLLLFACAKPASPPRPPEDPARPDASVNDTPAQLSSAEAGPSASIVNAAQAAERSTPAGRASRLRLVLIHAGTELLGSEQKRVDELVKELGNGAQRVEADSEEKALGASLAAATEPPNVKLPASWAGSERVLLINVSAPVGERAGQRQSDGLSQVALFAPPGGTPLYLENANGGLWFDPAGLARLATIRAPKGQHP